MPALRALRTEKTTRIEKEQPANAIGEFGHALDLYYDGDMETSIAGTSGLIARACLRKSVPEQCGMA